MSKSKIIGLAIVVIVGLLGLLGWWLFNTTEEKEAEKQVEQEVQKQEEAKKAEAVAKVAVTAAKDVQGEIRLDLDPWPGYFVARTEAFRKKMKQVGWLLKIEDDGGDYGKRLKRLHAGEVDIAVMTVDSNILNAAPYLFPGLMVMVIDQSKGGDTIYAREEVVKSLKDLRGKRAKVGYTPNSPSHHLLKAGKNSFDLVELLPVDKDLRVETNGSEEAFKLLLAGTIDVAALWEPESSKAATTKGLVKLFGTDETEGYIVDILVVNTNYLMNNKEVVRRFMANYFRTLKWYRDNPDEMKREIAKQGKLTLEQAENVIKGIEWVGLSENCLKWMGIAGPGEQSREMIVEVINSTVEVLMNNGDFKENPLPDGNPYRIFHVETLRELYLKEFVGFAKEDGVVVKNSLEEKFTAQSPEAWAGMREVAALRADPVLFQAGTARLSEDGKLALDAIAKRVSQLPNSRLKVVGHTSVDGEPEENKKLSLERTQAVKQYFVATYMMDANRFWAIGLGGEKPLEQLPDESMRAWKFRLPRVEIVLLREDL